MPLREFHYCIYVYIYILFVFIYVYTYHPHIFPSLNSPLNHPKEYHIWFLGSKRSKQVLGWYLEH